MDKKITSLAGHKLRRLSDKKNYRTAEFLQSILDKAADAYCLHNDKGDILDVNQTACDMLGYTRTEILSLKVSDFTGDSENGSDLSLCMLNEQQYINLEMALIHKDGHSIPVEVRRSKMIVENETYLVSYARDITKSKAIDKDLELTKFAVGQAATATFWYKTTDWRFFYVNDAACEYLGYAREELLEMTVMDINHEMSDADMLGNIERLRMMPSVLIEGSHVKKNGERIPIEALVKLINYDGEEYVISFVRDVSRRMEIERQLKQAKEKAERADRIKSEFLANMSHEIRTPLTGIIGFSEELKNPELTDAERAEMIEVIIKSSQHLGIIINDILDLTKIEAHQLKVENVAINPMDMFSEVEALMSRRAREKGLSFFADVSFPLPRLMTTDPVRLKQILLNLCGNAIKFTDKGEVRFGVQYNEQERMLTFIVRDTGIGMTEEEMGKIFAPFSQADESTTRRFGGTGLGLSISSELAKLLGGDIRCVSEKGKGSTFYLNTSIGTIGNVELEYSYRAPDVPMSQARVQQQLELQGRVLLAEDIDENQRLISMYLRRVGAEVDIVEDGVKAVDSAIDGNYDLILMDSQMPELDGLSAIRQLRGQGYKKPIVSITANAMAQDRQACLDAGADDYLKKPLELSELYRVLDSYLKDKNDNSGGSFQVYDENDPELRELKKYFVQTMPEYIEKLKVFSADKDWENLATVLHKLKGIGGSFGYPAVSRFSADIEEKVLSESYSSALSGIEGLIQMIEAILSIGD